LLFHRHSYVPTSFAFPFSDKTDAVLLPKTKPEYNFPSYIRFGPFKLIMKKFH
jgi:hypothetical protein